MLSPGCMAVEIILLDIVIQAGRRLIMGPQTNLNED